MKGFILSALINISTLTRRLAARLLLKNAKALRSLTQEDRVRLDELNREIWTRINEMARITSQTHEQEPTVVLPVQGFSVITTENTSAANDIPEVPIVFTMKNGSRCYHLPEQGVCCCDPCF